MRPSRLADDLVVGRAAKVLGLHLIVGVVEEVVEVVGVAAVGGADARVLAAAGEATRNIARPKSSRVGDVLSLITSEAPEKILCGEELTTRACHLPGELRVGRHESADDDHGVLGEVVDGGHHVDGHHHA